ncbi:MAG: Ig-like domain-containing protein [Bdellovibrionales bacterium]|nr:Ig-like domain-containing protein [Bdellovibrionales bacterium]
MNLVVVRFQGWHRILVPLVLSGLVALLIGCGVQSSDESSASGISVGGKTLIGVLMREDGSPISGASVSIPYSSYSATTDENGVSQIETSSISGSVEVTIQGSWGASNVLLNNIPEQAAVVDYEVSVDTSTQSATLRSLQITLQSPPTPSTTNSPVEISPRLCATCHEFRTETRCGDSNWEQLHSSVYRCPEAIVPPEIFDPIQDPTVSPVDDTNSDPVDKKEDKEEKPEPDKKKTNSCAGGCHEDRGSPRCGSTSWESIHSWYTCKSKEPKEDKDKGKKGKDSKGKDGKGKDEKGKKDKGGKGKKGKAHVELFGPSSDLELFKILNSLQQAG